MAPFLLLVTSSCSTVAPRSLSGIDVPGAAPVAEHAPLVPHPATPGVVNVASVASVYDSASSLELSPEAMSMRVPAGHGTTLQEVQVARAQTPVSGAASVPSWPGQTHPGDPVQPAAFGAITHQGVHGTSVRSVSHEVTPRFDIFPGGTGPQGMGVCPPGVPGGVCWGESVLCPSLFPDEYICDGGDKDIPVHYTGNIRHGLHFEDTVAEYVDHTGTQHTRPSSRVCVYAPRFASVRTIDVPHVEFTYDKVAGHHDGQRLVGVDHRQLPGLEAQADQPVGLDRRDRASGMIADVTEGSLTKIDWIGGNLQVNRLWQEIGFLRDGLMHQEDEPRLALAIALAADWSHDLYPIILADELRGSLVETGDRAAAMTGVEDRRTPGDLRLCKLCDQANAQPGDILTFTIRYDNLGGRELHGVRIVDNLSPRLELLPGTVTFDRPGTVDVQDNGGGSHLLIFELEELLPGESGGVLSFQCRVR